MMRPLNPCKKCGGPGVVITTYGMLPGRNYRVDCDTPACWVGPVCKTNGEAVEAWDTLMDTEIKLLYTTGSREVL
jgi:hypothetical protein